MHLSVNTLYGKLCYLIVGIHTIHACRIEIAETLLRAQIAIAGAVTIEPFLQCGFLHADEFLSQLLFFLVLVPIVVHDSSDLYPLFYYCEVRENRLPCHEIKRREMSLFGTFISQCHFFELYLSER